MKIAIVSDIHDNLVNLDKFLNWNKKNNIQAIICCGDLANQETLRYIADKFKGEIYLIRGNADIYNDEDLTGLDNIKYFGRVGYFEINSKKIGLCHEPFLIEKVLEKGKCDFVFYGHTHEPWIGQSDGARVANPGTLSGTFMKATFAVLYLEENSLELKILDNLKAVL